jgi:hypothetical protein
LLRIHRAFFYFCFLFPVQSVGDNLSRRRKLITAKLADRSLLYLAILMNARLPEDRAFTSHPL